ncbi:antibiotic biosynthesis monooxygenase [Paenibacillus spiritus]|uniref:Antibiotic biosynthesis monooxygenase n=1 Tax=Paenibacillus spiritus TaxID=2496557 RepID=A0A5J5FUH9_9BACL|nr:putative quinol monooxygenase [Paenibacillus spiritus]KAA8997205.1 antibiotic biosynthesis monooxygenase [Paenibacillus spiritus]
MFIIHARMTVKPEAQAEFLEAVRTLLTATRAEEGNLSYDLYESAERPGDFVMVEVWKDGAAVQAHNASPHFQAFAGQASSYLTAPLDVKVYQAEQAQM